MGTSHDLRAFFDEGFRGDPSAEPIGDGGIVEGEPIQHHVSINGLGQFSQRCLNGFRIIATGVQKGISAVLSRLGGANVRALAHGRRRIDGFGLSD